MPAISTIISCPAGQWTSIAQYMESRRSLMVQCPEQNLTVAATSPAVLNDGAAHTIAAADPLRRSMTIAVGPPDVSVSVGTFGPNGAPLFAIDPASTIPLTVNVNDYDYPQSVKSLWSATVLGDGTHGCPVTVLTEVSTCAAIILGIVNTVATYAGPGGTVPVGVWQSPDLSSGGTQFRLDNVSNADLVIQEWFAWPVGSGSVKVQVFQAFDMPEPETQLTVQIPALSPHGKKAAQDLLAAMMRSREDGLRTTDDA